MDFEFKDLIKNLDEECFKSLEAGSSLCVSRTNYEVSVSHVLLNLLESVDGDIQKILHHYGVDITHFTKAVQHSLESMKSGNSGRPVFSPYLQEWLQDAWLLASLNYKQDKVRSGILFLALLSNPYKYGPNDFISLLKDISVDELKTALPNIVGESAAAPSGDTAGKSTPMGGAPGGESALSKYTVNFTEKARSGEIDPVFCRDREIRQMIDILGRRRKNNPILVGEAGVGKTAVVEGLALSIINNDVPQILQGVELYGLDMGLLQAGASVKGEFEKRLKAVINEIKSSTQNIILFIDEAHTLIGAGGSAGQNDAANLLKPALARGELKTIAATTWSEYKKYFEKDPALARRFQLIKIEEPSVDEAVIIMRGLREHYEAAHDIYIQDKAIEASAELSARYLSGRQLPDKSVDLLDTACARVKISLTSKPDAISDKERAIQTLQRELHAVQRDINAGVAQEQDRVAELNKQISDIEAELVVLNQRWEAEKELVNKILELRGNLNDVDNTAALNEIQQLEKQLAEKQGDNPLVYYEVKADTISRVISDWTGIPVGSMVKDEASVILDFKDELAKRIKGQDHAIDALDRGIKSAKAGLASPDSPIGVFLFVGPSGVGKTESAIGLADLLFGGERFLISINMSEFQEKHTVSRLIGSPPGYVGYGEGGVLTEAVRQRPYSVVLLDEVEKADLEVMNLFYQVFDKGMLSDGEGREINFRNTAIVLTSNLASDIIMQMCADGEYPDIDDLNAAIRPILSNHFKPALLARMEIVPFYPIHSDAMRDIVSIKLRRLKQRLQENQKMQLIYDDSLVDVITKKCTEAETGARNIDYIINRNMLPRMSNEILSALGQKTQVSRLLVTIKDGDFSFSFE